MAKRKFKIIIKGDNKGSKTVASINKDLLEKAMCSTTATLIELGITNKLTKKEILEGFKEYLDDNYDKIYEVDKMCKEEN